MTTIGTTNIKFSEIYNAINDNDHNGTDNIAISDFRGTGYNMGGTVPNTGAITIGTHFKNKTFPLYVFSSHTFKSCGASKLETSGSSTGGRRYGPTLAECRAEYTPTWVDNTAYFNIVTQGIQEWTVPETGTYKIIAKGAAGGYAGRNTTMNGGFGAVIEGKFSLTMGEKIKILVGQLGETYRSTNAGGGGGGGGGTFVLKTPYSSVASVLIVAGGGGGSNAHGHYLTVPDMNGILVNTTSTGGGSSVSYGEGGGGGLIGNGSGTGKGYSFVTGALGGIGGYSSNRADYRNYGGFGGGGGNGAHAGGGGGGMSGGSATQFQQYQGGYGGGSYNTGTSQSAVVNTTVEDGEVEITFIPPFTSHTFTNCGATGRYGPTLANCTSTYTASWASDTSLFNMTSQGIQEWTVPDSGSYKIEAYGASGGDDKKNYDGGEYNWGGKGVKMEGVFQLNNGSVIFILVGQLGIGNVGTGCGGGGGGTFVVTKSGASHSNAVDGDILLVAGGGGGGGWKDTSDEIDAHTLPRGGNTKDETGAIIYGGVNGAGGGADTGNDGSSGGGGFLGNGLMSYGSGSTRGGKSFVNGGVGGESTITNDTHGGFGGGGDEPHSNHIGGGGGGGYSGGAGGSNYGSTYSWSGGGGGSKNNGSSQVNGIWAHTRTTLGGGRQGKVIITKL